MKCPTELICPAPQGLESATTAGTALSRGLGAVSRSMLVMALLMTAVAGVTLADVDQADARVPTTDTICYSLYNGAIVVDVGNEHMFAFNIEKYTANGWQFVRYSGWQYGRRTFTEDGWGNPLTAGFYRVFGLTYDMWERRYNWVSYTDIDFRNSVGGNKATDTNRNWCRIF